MSSVKVSIVLSCLIFSLNFNISTGATSNDTKSLLRELFTTNDYNAMIRPVINQSEPTIVQVGLTLVGLTDLIEVSGKLTTRGYMEITWMDEHLVWNPNHFGGIQYLHVPLHYIWKPDLHLKNGFSKFSRLGGSTHLAKVSCDGQVLWNPFEVFDTTCVIDISRFPFDTQHCEISFIAWSSDIQDIKLLSKNFTLEGTVFSSEWHILETSKGINLFHHEPVVHFNIRLKRKPLFIILNIIIPVLFLSYLDILVFVLPENSGEKIGYAMTLFLAFIVFLTIVSSLLPVNSDNISLLGIYLMFQITMATVTVLVTTIQLRLNFRNPEIKVEGFWLKAVHLSRFLQIWSRNNKKPKVADRTAKTSDKISINDEEEGEKKNMGNGTAEPETENGEDANVTWVDVCSELDFLCFVLFSLTRLISTGTLISAGLL